MLSGEKTTQILVEKSTKGSSCLFHFLFPLNQFCKHLYCKNHQK